MTWTTIPRWLYENDLPEDELQAVYVRALRRKVGGIGVRLCDVEAERDALLRQLGEALTMLREAEAALARYQGARRG